MTISAALTCSTASRAARDDRLADRDPHRSAHKSEVEHGDHRAHPTDAAARDGDRLRARRRARPALAQPLGIAPAVAKAQRVDRGLGQLDGVERAAVEQQLEALAAADAEMMAAMPADHQVGGEVAGQEGLLAARALAPQIVWHLLAPDQGADLRQDEIGEPVHGLARAPDSLGERRDVAEDGGDEPGLGRTGGVEVLREAVDQRRADHGGVGGAGDRGGLLGSLDPEADRDRQAGRLADAGNRVAHPGGVGRARAGDAGDRDVIDKPAGALDDIRQPRWRR